MEQVMNNNDLRGIIFSFFRTKPHKQCQNCKVVIMWNQKKILHKFIEWNNFINCNECYKFNFFKSLNDRLFLSNYYL